MLIVALACAALVSIALIGLSWPRRDDPEVSAFMLLALGCALWSGARLMEVVSFDMPVRVGWAKVAYIGIMIVPAAWLRMVVGLTRPECNALPAVRLGWVAALLLAAGFLGLVATNELHHLVWLDARFVAIDGVQRAVFDHGRIFWVGTAYNYLLLGLSLVLLTLPASEAVTALYGMSRTRVRLALLAGQLLPLVAHLAYLQRWTTALGGDLTPATFALSTALLGWLVLLPRLRDTAVYARGKIIEAMRDGCIVLAADGSIATINAAARYLMPTARLYAAPPAELEVATILREFERTRLQNRHQQRHQVWVPQTGRTLEITLEGLTDARDRHVGVFLLLRDVTVEQLQRAGMASVQNALRGELQRTQAKLSLLENDVNRDALTHLFNRRFFETQAPRLLDHARRDGRSVTLALFDIDCFKQYNDTYGHLQGDECLRMVAETLDGACHHPDDFIARVGGEEFAAMLFDLGMDEAHRAVARMVGAVAARAHPHVASAVVPYVTLSAGAVTFTPGDERLDALFERADTALYEAKRGGRNTFRFHHGGPGLRSVSGGA